MNDTSFVFSNFGDTYSFAQKVGVRRSLDKCFEKMSFIERLKLTVQRSWVIEVKVRYKLKNTDALRQDVRASFSSMIKIYADLLTFQKDYNDLTIMSSDITEGIKIIGLRVYQLYHDPNTVIYLDCPSTDSTLSSQLNFWTGCSFNMIDFHNENNSKQLSAQGMIVHRETQQKFFIPAVDVESLYEYACG